MQTVLIGLFGLFILVCGTLVGIACWMLKAWVLCYLWEWFIIPQFNVPAITLIGAMGLMLTVSFFLANDNAKAKHETAKAKVISFIGLYISAPLLVLLFGYIIHSYFPLQ